MFDIGSSELLLIVIVAVVVIGPKDLPRVLYKLGQIIGKGRAMTRHLRSGIDEMIRQAELEEMEKKWAADNARIMAQNPAPKPEDGSVGAATVIEHGEVPALAGPEAAPAPSTPAPVSSAEPVAAPVMEQLPHAPAAKAGDGAPPTSARDTAPKSEGGPTA